LPKEEKKSGKKKISRKSTIREFLEIIISVIIFVLFLNVYLVQGYQIPTGSMEDTLMIGDRIFVNKFLYSPVPSFLKCFFPAKEPERGEIIVFRYPKEPTKFFVKRLVGMPNETIIIRNKRVYANGRRIEFPGKERFFRYWWGDNYGPVTIPPDHYFMMGDNRDNSRDSRTWGFVNRDLIKGKVLFVYFSIQDLTRATKESNKRSWKRIRWKRFLKLVD